MTESAKEIYIKYVKGLSVGERLRLLEITAQELITDVSTKQNHERSLLSLEGLGAEIWEGIDAQDYVDEMRKEWDHRP